MVNHLTFLLGNFQWQLLPYKIPRAKGKCVTTEIHLFLGTLFTISVFSKKLRADDAVLGMISTTSKMAGALVMAFARNDNEVYIGLYQLIVIGNIVDHTPTWQALPVGNVS